MKKYEINVELLRIDSTPYVVTFNIEAENQEAAEAKLLNDLKQRKHKKIVKKEDQDLIDAKSILVVNRNQPVLNTIKESGGLIMHLSRDRYPDKGWGELRHTSDLSDSISEVPLTPELSRILLEDLAYAFGSDSNQFYKKMIEFDLINH